MEMLAFSRIFIYRIPAYLSIGNTILAQITAGLFHYSSLPAFSYFISARIFNNLSLSRHLHHLEPAGGNGFTIFMNLRGFHR